MTKKIKIIISIILTSVVVISSTLVILYCNTISFAPKINKPDQIVVYYNNAYTNIVFEPNDKTYDEIYSSISRGCSKRVLSALFSNSISNKAKVESHDLQNIKFDGIRVAFLYNSPQVVMLKNNIYIDGENSYWYQSLIFSISNNNSYTYNTIAIVPPENDSNYVSSFSHTLSYMVYSNFHSTYNKCVALFQ